MQEYLRQETESLIRSWSCYDRNTLAEYLVQDVEDPRINIQSILTRHFLIRKLFGQSLDFLMDQELRFALVVNWAMSLLKQGIQPRGLHSLLHALIEGQNEDEGIPIPKYVTETFAALSLPNYICDLLTWELLETTEVPIPDRVLSTFQKIWSQGMEKESASQISVLEAACGSANDYRFIDSFGIARFIDYTGFDLCQMNIDNARAMFPNADFRIGNALEIDAPDNSFDFCIVHDLFEHLSLKAMEVALAEVCRVTRKALCIGFFNMYDSPEHVEQYVRHYHWNKLSLHRIKESLTPYAPNIEVIHIDSFLNSTFNCPDTHNKNAHTLIATIQ